MALTRNFIETIKDRADRDPDFRKELLRESVETFLSGDAEGYPGGLIETMNGGVRARSCAAQPPSDRKTPCLENPRPKGGILTDGERRFSISG
jgi:hypothetical protein